MKLSTRLLLLILGCMLPILAAQLYTEVKQHAEWHVQLTASTQRQAERVMIDLASSIDSMRRIAVVAARLPDARTTGPGCANWLSTLQGAIPGARFLSVVDADGALLCATVPETVFGGDSPLSWLASSPNASALATASAPTVGRLSTAPGLPYRFLPVAIRVAGEHGDDTLIVALDPAWIASRLAEITRRRVGGLGDPILYLVDRDGRIIGQFPPGSDGTPECMPAMLSPLLNKTAADAIAITDQNGTPCLVARVPAPPSFAGAMAVAVTPLPGPLSYVGTGSIWDIVVTGGCTLTALTLAWLAGRRFIYLPTEMLLRTAQRWRDGDLNVRAALTESGSEFGALAQSFNAMASSLQARDLERRLQAGLLESLVAERTRALSDINNRLQVEVAEREKTEAALHQAQKLQAVGQLAGGIAHDFNNMLATILGNLELMQHRVGRLTELAQPDGVERLTALIERATGAVQRGAQLTSRLLAFSRRQRLATRPTDLNRLVAELVTLATSTLGRRVRVVTDLAPDLWPAMVDPSQVEAAILNLCLNARDAMPDGGQLTISTANEMLEAGPSEDDPEPGPFVRVSITDTGHGMAPDVQRQAFDPFFTTKGPGGSGLGLSQVYGMARQSGGTVRLESTEGKGTEVALLLPRAASDEEAEVPHRHQTSPRQDLSKLLVMVVDDDPTVRQVAVEMLRDIGCTVVQAPGGTEALKMIDDLPRSPDVILLDYAMPGMNGLRVATILRQRGSTAGIALVTGYAELAETDIEASPFDGLLRKPFTIRDLRLLIAALHDRPKELLGGIVAT